jgi:hypothetical protein
MFNNSIQYPHANFVSHSEERAVCKRAAVFLFFLLFAFFTGAMRAGGVESGVKVMRVEVGKGRAAIEVWIGQGIAEGVLPGMKFDIIHAGTRVGGIEVAVAGAHSAKGVFSSGCDKCVPMPGDSALLNSGSFFGSMTPPIVVPGTDKKPKKGSVDDFESLKMAFGLFMNGKPGLEPGDEDEPSPPLWPKETVLPSCPPAPPDNETALAVELKSDLFLESGDMVRVDGWPPHSPFCPTVDDRGYLWFPGVGPMLVRGKTVMRMETALRERLAAKGLQASPTLTPMHGTVAASEIFVLGEVANPGMYEFNTAVTVEESISKAGGAAPDSNGTAVVVARDETGQLKSTFVKLPAAGVTGTDVIPCVDESACRAFIFLPSSPEHLEAFFKEVLPYIEE